ncbi:MAG: hypothetical protein ACRDND_30385, partial [Streptosporangiaceae bacterium]
MAAVGALGFQELLGAFGAAAFGVGERGDGAELGLVLVAEGVTFAAGISADAAGLGNGALFGLAGAGGLGLSPACCPGGVIAFTGAACYLRLGRAGLRGCLGAGCADLGGGTGTGLVQLGGGCLRFGAGGGGLGVGGAGVVAGGIEGLGHGPG